MAYNTGGRIVSGREARLGEGAGPEDKRVVSGMDAKSGIKLGVMRYVLIVSMSLVIIGFALAWVVQRL
jgi:hypothetical protein